MEKFFTEDSDCEPENPYNLPIFVMDQHHHAYDKIKNSVGNDRLPENGNTIIHFDAHIDELVPKDLQIRHELESDLSISKLFEEFGTENWLKNAVDDKCIKNVIWVKPPWARQVEDCHVDLQNNVQLDIKTLGKSVFDDSDEDYEGFKTIFSKYLKPKDPFILDFEYNFFSSDNPFTSHYPVAKEYYSLLKTTFELEIPTEDLKKAAEKRNEQLVQLKDIFDCLEENRIMPSEEKYLPEIYQKVYKLREHLLNFYSDERIEWHTIFNAGVVCNDLQLPVRHTSCEDIKKMLGCVGKILDLLPGPPSIVTIAIMYEYDRYTPLDTCEFIGDTLKEFFENRYENANFVYED